MRKIIGYLKTYLKELDKRIFAFSALLATIGVFINYYFGMNDAIAAQSETAQYFWWFLVFLLAFGLPYLAWAVLTGNNPFRHSAFVLLFVLAPALFAWKMCFDHEFGFSPDYYKNAYWNFVFYWPFKLAVVFTVLFITWKLAGERDNFYGFTVKNFSARPYFFMLLIMLPLVAAASTQPDFLAMYPKLKNIQFLGTEHNLFYELLYELAYGSDFITIELFFRGFLILGFARWAGKNAILPMAVFYCAIHFGKPMGECISSFFGGAILGVVTYHTRSIFGGLIVHLGIAWMMEVGGYLGHLWS